MLSEFQDPRWKLLTDYQFKGLYAETALYLILKDLGYSPKWTGYNGYFKDNPHSGDFLLDGIRLDSKNVNGRYFISQYANALEGAYDIGIQFGRKSLEADREAYTRHGKLALILPEAIIEADILTAKGLTLKYQEYRGKLRYYLPKLMARLKPAKHSVHQSLRGISNKSYSMSYSHSMIHLMNLFTVSFQLQFPFPFRWRQY